ncbi:metal-binding protein [Methylovulum miyakonense]|uniref:metal-binding protein n=1 Tax=Methylovulum miyakonense TaxID=645578 RepID=UPI003BB61309
MEKESCTLCGQPVKLEGFTQTDSDGIKKFCCGGCLSLFRLIYPHGGTSPINKETANNNTNNEEST